MLSNNSHHRTIKAVGITFPYIQLWFWVQGETVHCEFISDDKLQAHLQHAHHSVLFGQFNVE